jgi:phospholipase/carboxylesterase
LFVFPQAPFDIAGGAPGPYDGRAWWPIDMTRLQIAALTGRIESLAEEHPEGMDSARAELDAFLDALLGHFGLPGDRLVLGGFSQGAMLTCDLALRTERPLAGLVQLSGTTLCQDEWFPLLPRRKGLRVLQSHAPDDPILPFTLAERLHNAALDAGLDARFVRFVGGHGVGQPVLDALGGFLREILP